MKQLIPMDEYGIFVDTKDTARANSLMVAEMFGKNHKEVLRDIRKITDPKSGLSEKFRQRNFAPSSYVNEQNKKQPYYDMTRDGFTMLVMGYTGQRAMQFKEAYIKRFNEMEKQIADLVSARVQFPRLTAQIALLHENPRPYHFSNECDMLNRLVIGMSAKQFRAKHGLDKCDSIRPHLTAAQIALLDELQIVDIGLLIAMPDFNQRRRQLEWYLAKKTGLIETA